MASHREMHGRHFLNSYLLTQGPRGELPWARELKKQLLKESGKLKQIGIIDAFRL